MDFLDIMYYAALWVIAAVVYRLLVREKKDKTKGHYTKPAWNFVLKKLYAERIVRKLKCDEQKFVRDMKKYESEAPKILANEESSDSQLVYGSDQDGNSILLKFTRRRHRIAEIWLILKLSNGETYTMPDHPNTRIVNATPRIFEGSGLKFECLRPYSRWRITFSGMLRRGVRQTVTTDENDLFFAKLNFIWATCCDPIFWPFDWSPELMATSLATEPWRDGKWMTLHTKRESGGYDQFGACFGQIKIHEKDSMLYMDGLPKVQTYEVNLPGVRQRRWGPHKVQHLHRTGVLFGCAKDGTVFEVGAFSGKYGLTHSQFGNVRMPDGRVFPIDWTDFHLAALGEYQDKLPQATIVQIKAGGRQFTIIVTFKNNSKMSLFGGNPIDWNSFFVPTEIAINTQSGFGAAMFWYPRNLKQFQIEEMPTKIKRIFHRFDPPSIFKQILSFTELEAQSILVSGGKGASLAILRNIQETKGADLYDKRNRSTLILNALVDQFASKSSATRTKKPMFDIFSDEPPKRGRQRAGSLKYIFPDSHNFDIPGFYVPQGFIISCSVLTEHLKLNPEVFELLKELELTVYEKQKGNITEICKEIYEAFIKTNLNDDLKMMIDEKLKLINFDDTARFAVRSSGVAEDGEEASAAGQNDTFLGLRTSTDVFKAIIKCWASLYTFQSVQYRRQNCQAIQSGMAVVVQKMVKADSAGVLFTRHPVNGDPSVMLITANFGLGESVVSSKVDPDTFLIKRTYKDDVQMLGAKKGEKKLLIEMDEEFYTKEVALDEEMSNKLCLSNDNALKLAKLGIILEKFFGTPRDIEFAIANGKIYLLQSRAITALHNFTDYEIIHENDSAFMSNDDIRTRANIGEVLVGASSLLTQSVFRHGFDKSMFKIFNSDKVDCSDLFSKYVHSSHYHLLLDVNSIFMANLKGKLNKMETVNTMSVFGSDIFTNNSELLRIACHRNAMREKTYTHFKHLFKSIYFIKTYMKDMDEILEKAKNKFSPNQLQSFQNSLDISNSINEGFLLLGGATSRHINASNNSVIYQLIAFAVLTQKGEKLTMDHQRDIALILGSISDVESATIPHMIHEMAVCILSQNKKDEFLQVDNNKAIEWMKMNCDEVYELFNAFIIRHGHRTLNELDFVAKSWSMVPEKIIEMIKTNLKLHSKKEMSKIKSTEELLNNLKTPLSRTSKWILRKLIPKCHRGVQYRETAKSRLVGVVHEIRKALLALGSMMVHEGLLPDSELIFHLSWYEIKTVLATKNSSPVRKAIRRQKLYAKLKELKFPELTFGFPQPEKIPSTNNEKRERILVKGIPVCGGTVTGRACVLKSFDEVDKLQNDDILVVNATDIAWSPYFPILGGVCTELGGLVSHGAVVAREFNLPCIIGAKFATSKIKHGEMIHLNADEGIVTSCDDE